jgi:hypothetical protein
MTARHTVRIEIDQMLYVPVYLNERGPYTFNLDTGCLGLSCSPEVAREIGLSAEPQGPRRLQSLTIGSYRLTDFPIGIGQTLGKVCEILGRRVDGQMGNMFFEYLGLAVTLDYPGQTMTLEERNSRRQKGPVVEGKPVPPQINGAGVSFRRPDEEDSVRVPVQISSGYTVVPVYVEEQGPYDFVLDTGAAICAVSPEVAQALNLPHGETATARGAVEDVECYRSCVSRLRAGDVACRNLSVIVCDHSYLYEYAGRRIDGHLGYNFLQDFRVTLDYGKGQG